MTITLNGKPHEIEGENLKVNELVAALELGDHPVLVELNGEAILVREFEQHCVTNGDTVEIVRMVAGG
ncbi:MAG: sulfur carrier protein ThiS [Verrucomicrobiota bacterium]